jgi:inorganic pyrophosphatase
MIQIPQTRENPNVDHTFTGFEGDNDPIDFFDIGQDIGYIGQVKQVKILGGLAPNDGDETDWKLLVIDVNDPIADLVNSWEDVDQYRPGVTQAFYEWFQYYKVARGDDVIPIIGESYQSAEFIINTIIPEGHQYWLDLISGEEDPGKINFNQTSFPEFDSYIDPSETTETLDIPSESAPEPAAAKPSQYDEWYYLDEDFELIEQSA